MRNAAVIIFFIPFILSCEKKIDWSLQSNPAEQLVVDGIITNEYMPYMVKLSKSVSNINQVPQTVSGATVSIFDGSATYILKESVAGSGIYVTDTSLIGVISSNYLLKIVYHNKLDTAVANMIGVSSLDTLQYALNPGNGLYYVSYVAPTYLKDESDMYKIMIDWSEVTGYPNLSPSSGKVELDYYSLSTIDINELYAPAGAVTYFPKGAKIVEKKYSLTPRYASFIRSMLSQTQWNGGNFDVITSNVASNISNGASGFFAVCQVIKSDTIIVK